MAKKLLTTPRGVAIWPRVSGKPDQKFNRWSTQLKIEGAEGVALAKEINGLMKAHLVEAQKEAGKKKLKMAAPAYTKGEDGHYVFKFSQLASGVSKKTNKPWETRPVLYQANGTPYTDEPKIGAGTIMRVMYEFNPWVVKDEAGVSLRLSGVKVIKLVEWTSVTEQMTEDESDGEAGPGTEDADAPTGETAPAAEESDDF